MQFKGAFHGRSNLRTSRVGLYEKTDENGRPMILLHAADGDIVLSAPNGRIHFYSQMASREVTGS